MSDSGKKAPNRYDSMVDKAKNSWPVSIIIASFALLSGAKGFMESLDYFSNRLFNKQEYAAEKIMQQATFPGVRTDSIHIPKQADAVAVASKKEMPAVPKQSVVIARQEAKPTEQITYTLPQMHSGLSKIFRQKGQASRIEMDEKGKIGIFQKDGSYSKFMIQHIRLEWNSGNSTIGLVSDSKSIVWHGIATFRDGTHGWNTERISGVMYSFSKSDFEEVKQFLAQYRKYVSGSKK